MLNKYIKQKKKERRNEKYQKKRAKITRYGDKKSSIINKIMNEDGKTEYTELGVPGPKTQGGKRKRKTLKRKKSVRKSRKKRKSRKSRK